MVEISEMGIPKDLEKKGLNWRTEKLSLQAKVASELQHSTRCWRSHVEEHHTVHFIREALHETVFFNTSTWMN